MLELRQEIDGCGTLSGLAAMARKSEQDILGIMETSAKNAQAILELRQEIAGCVAIKLLQDASAHADSGEYYESQDWFGRYDNPVFHTK